MTDLHAEDRDGIAVYAIRGHLDLVAAPQLKALVDETVKGGLARGIIDLSATDFIDSSGLGAVIGGLKAAREAGGDLRLAGVSGQVERAIELMKLHRVFGRYATVEEAMHGFD